MRLGLPLCRRTDRTQPPAVRQDGVLHITEQRAPLPYVKVSVYDSVLESVAPDLQFQGVYPIG